MGYTVLVDDNFHYMDEDERYTLGQFSTLEEAVVACKQIVDEFLLDNYKPKMPPEELIALYKNFGEDPFIIGSGVTTVLFSAWTYAEDRCREICKDIAAG